MTEGNSVSIMLFHTPDPTALDTHVIGQIDELRSTLRSRVYEPRRWTQSLRRVQFARGVQGSNSIEGYNAALDDAMAIDMGEPPLDADTETVLAISGYKDAMTYVLQSADEPNFHFGEQLLKSLHFMMISYDMSKRPGRWRAGSIYVHNDEKQEIVYEGPDIDRVPALMHELVCQLEADDSTSNLVKAAMAHLNLVMIHPFADGNGRMARCLQTLVLARGGILSPVFSSIEEYLGRNTPSYYDILAQVGGGSWNPQNDARPWVRYVLTAHFRQANTLLRRTREVERLYFELDSLVQKHGLHERTVEALFDAVSGRRVRNSVYRAIVQAQDEAMNEQIASRDLKNLVSLGLIIPHGEKRGRYYTAGQPIRDIANRVREQRPARDLTDPFDINLDSIGQEPLF
jgi:Fic family protein